jgi:hypothetical protein
MDTMPEPLKGHWEAIDEEVVWLHGRWIIYRQLFGTSPERVELLNESAATFFFIIQTVLLNDVQLTLSKLADPTMTSGRQNLTLESLVKDIDQLGDATLRREVDGMRADYQDRCRAVRHRRNKQLAHFDLATLIAGKNAPLPGPSRQEIEAALGVLRLFMNTLQQKFTHSETAYDQFILRSDGDQLLSVLKEGLRYEELVDAGSVA